ncbi:universal stress protein [Methylonatrum kenyense]|uniref:universal stress protein n=1 Tax=Methylonatrum kenyense TaxID=455253 RepID=UPI0020BE7D80|nr:universal stress protein [Methylonatrum kenyense]MCK8516505.1 universal stress protein [Methylonatrum kenyense]
MTDIRTLIIGCDGSEHALVAARYASTLARSTGASVKLVHVFPRTALDLIGMHGPSAAMVGIDPFDQETFTRLSDDAAAQAFDLAAEQLDPALDVERVRLAGDPSTELVRYAKEAESPLVLLGHRGLGRISGALMGSVSQRVIHHAPCPVMVIP